jgi:hypothetical protein
VIYSDLHVLKVVGVVGYVGWGCRKEPCQRPQATTCRSAKNMFSDSGTLRSQESNRIRSQGLEAVNHMESSRKGCWDCWDFPHLFIEIIYIYNIIYIYMCFIVFLILVTSFWYTTPSILLHTFPIKKSRKKQELSSPSHHRPGDEAEDRLEQLGATQTPISWPSNGPN